MLRVTGGDLRGRSLRAVPSVRPTASKVRQAIFDLLQRDPRFVSCARWLDACAGSGAVGIEALSRGASFVTFVEQDAAARKALDRNLRDLGLGSRSAVVPLPIERALPRLAERREIDVVFLDPPYADDPALLVADCLGVLRPGGVLVVEIASRRRIDLPAGTRVRRYGDTTLALITGDA